MNVENILAVADAIEQHSIPDLGFSMGSFRQPADRHYRDLTGQHCGTVACIAGWGAALAEAEEVFFDDAADYFDIDGNLAAALFCPPGWSSSPEQYTPVMAVATLRHLAATGEVDWDRATTSPAS